MTMAIRVVLLLFSLCFAGGGATHVMDIARGGFLPYRDMPPAINMFWTSLALFDFLAVLLLWTRRRAGVALTVAIMLADVAVNSYAVYGLGIVFQSFAPLQAQTWFLGFVLGAAGFVWEPRGGVPHAAARGAGG